MSIYREPPPSTPWVPTCHGYTRYGAPCPLSEDLDVEGYCPRHSLYIARCPGTCLDSGRPCKKWKNLNPSGWCKFHDPNAPRCIAIKDIKGNRCKCRWDLNAQGLCIAHARKLLQGELVGLSTSPLWILQQLTVTETPTGQNKAMLTTASPGVVGVNADQASYNGALNSMGESSNNKAKDYCSYVHDVDFAASYAGPSVFESIGKKEIADLFDRRDLYHGDKLNVHSTDALELDRIIDFRCFSFAFQAIEFSGGLEEVTLVVNDIVNRPSNLCDARDYQQNQDSCGRKIPGRLAGRPS